jgi:hypothetical protein
VNAEEEALALKVRFEAWLAAKLGPPPYLYPWGRIDVVFSPQEIRISKAERRRQGEIRISKAERRRKGREKRGRNASYEQMSIAVPLTLEPPSHLAAAGERSAEVTLEAVPQTLFHYTAIDNLAAILTSSALVNRLVACSADEDDMKVAAAVFDDVIERKTTIPGGVPTAMQRDAWRPCIEAASYDADRNHPANCTPILAGVGAAGRVVPREARQFAGTAALVHTSGSSSSMRAMGQPS